MFIRIIHHLPEVFLIFQFFLDNYYDFC